MNWQSFRGDAPANMIVHTASFPDVSDQWPLKDDVTRQINAINQTLVENPQMQPPRIEKDASGHKRIIPLHPLSERVYRDRPALVAWRTKLVPSALALYAIQNPLEEHLPDGTKMDSESRPWFIHANDAIGIRSRAQVLAILADKYIKNDIDNVWVSLASGAAVPVFEALRKAHFYGQKVRLTLVDCDRVSLRWASKLATLEGLSVGDDVVLLQRDLIESVICSDALIQELGQQRAELVDALGIFEYFSDADAVTFLKHTQRLVRPGGAIIVSNMLTTSPHAMFR